MGAGFALCRDRNPRSLLMYSEYTIWDKITTYNFKNLCLRGEKNISILLIMSIDAKNLPPSFAALPASYPLSVLWGTSPIYLLFFI